MLHINDSGYVWMSHVTHEWVLSHMNESHESRPAHTPRKSTHWFVTWLIDEWSIFWSYPRDMTHLSLIFDMTHWFVTWLIDWHDSLMNESRPAHTFRKSMVPLSRIELWLDVYIIWYGVATISRLLRIIALFCKRALWKKLYSAKETYIFKEPTNRSHPICDVNRWYWVV